MTHSETAEVVDAWSGETERIADWLWLKLCEDGTRKKWAEAKAEAQKMTWEERQGVLALMALEQA